MTLRTDTAPGRGSRACALALAAAAALAVASGAAGAGAPHRVLAALAGPPLAAILVAGAVAHRRLLAPAAAPASSSSPPRSPRHAAHVVLAALALAAALVLAVLTWRGAPVAAGAWRDYVTLTKPRIMTLLLLTGSLRDGRRRARPAAPGGSCNDARRPRARLRRRGALNHVLDRDIDQLMGPRTAGRPVAAGRLTAPRALEFGLALSAASFTLLASTANLLTAALALVGNLFYVVVYTGYLKRRGPQNIVLGGAAGAVPPLVGYAAATGNVALPALWLFLIVFLWTPPHFWALALLLREHYARAPCRCCRSCAASVTLRRIVGYTVVLVASASCRWRRDVRPALPRRGARARRAVPRLALALQRRPTTKGAAASSTTRCCTSRCSSSPRRSTRCLGARPGADRRPPAGGHVEHVPHPAPARARRRAGEAVDPASRRRTRTSPSPERSPRRHRGRRAGKAGASPAAPARPRRNSGRAARFAVTRTRQPRGT